MEIKLKTFSTFSNGSITTISTNITIIHVIAGFTDTTLCSII